MSAVQTPSRGVWQVYGQSIAAALVVIATAVQAALSDSATGGRITQIEMVQIAIAICNAGLVWLVPNVPQWPWMKTILAAVLAALQLATSLIVDGIGSADVSALVIAVLMVLGPAAAPSRSTVPAADAPPTFDDGGIVYTDPTARDT